MMLGDRLGAVSEAGSPDWGLASSPFASRVAEIVDAGVRVRLTYIYAGHMVFL